MRLYVKFSLLCLALMTLQGCGGSDEVEKHQVTGTVTYNGKPIEKGSITFDPADNQGVAAMGGIENGQFTAEVPPGEKILRISAVRETGEKDQYGEVITESYIPAKYNVESNLKKTVEPNGENKFDLALADD